MEPLLTLLTTSFLGKTARVWWYLGAQSRMEYLTGFMVEKTLAMDNVFVIACSLARTRGPAPAAPG